MKAVQFTEYGGPDVLQLIDHEKPGLSKKEVLVEIKSIGVNYADTARREGQYVVPTPLPFIPGAEIAGIVRETGSDVTNLKPGTPVAALIESGGYAEYAAVEETDVIPLPEEMDLKDAAALLLQGLSAYHILKTMGRLEKGETVLIHAAAGGVGSLAVQLAKLFGAGKIIATASTKEKLAFAREMGADICINYTETGWEKQVLKETAGEGVDVALEMAGGEILRKTFKCLAPFGRLVIYGVASGNQEKFYPSSLMAGNQSVIGFFLPQIMRNHSLLEQSMKELLKYVMEGKLKLTIGGEYPLEEAVQVHTLLQGRQTMGKMILHP